MSSYVIQIGKALTSWSSTIRATCNFCSIRFSEWISLKTLFPIRILKLQNPDGLPATFWTQYFASNPVHVTQKYKAAVSQAHFFHSVFTCKWYGQKSSTSGKWSTPLINMFNPYGYAPNPPGKNETTLLKVYSHLPTTTISSSSRQPIAKP